MKAETNRVITSFAVTPQMQKQLKEYRKEHGVRISWLINNLLQNYFERLGGKNNG